MRRRYKLSLLLLVAAFGFWMWASGWSLLTMKLSGRTDLNANEQKCFALLMAIQHEDEDWLTQIKPDLFGPLIPDEMNYFSLTDWSNLPRYWEDTSSWRSHYRQRLQNCNTYVPPFSPKNISFQSTSITNKNFNLRITIHDSQKVIASFLMDTTYPGNTPEMVLLPSSDGYAKARSRYEEMLTPFPSSLEVAYSGLEDRSPPADFGAVTITDLDLISRFFGSIQALTQNEGPNPGAFTFWNGDYVSYYEHPFQMSVFISSDTGVTFKNDRIPYSPILVHQKMGPLLIEIPFERENDFIHPIFRELVPPPLEEWKQRMAKKHGW